MTRNRRALWLLAAILSGAQAARAAPTPMDAPLKDDGVTTIECDVVDRTEPATALKIIGPVPPSAKLEGYHYNLYLPRGYSQNRDFRYPCLFIADAGGNANMGAMAERLKRDEWIVAMLKESRNSSDEWLNNFLAAHDDVVRRVRVAKGAKFTTGFSGGARCSSLNALARPGMAGVICQAAGFSYDDDLKKVPPYTPYYYRWFPTHILVAGTFGDKDGNIGEAHDLRRDLPASRVNILLFEGGHSSCPSTVFGSVLDWMEEELFLNPRPAAAPPHQPRDFKVFPPEPPDAEAYRWYLRKLARLLDEAKEPPVRYLALGRLLAAAEKGKLASDRDVAESVQKWQAELAALKAAATVREFEAKALAAYRGARAAEDAYARQMTLERAETTNQRMAVSAEDRQALEKALAAYQAVARDWPDSPFGAESRLRAASLAIEQGKVVPRKRPQLNPAKVVSVTDGNTMVISTRWKIDGKIGSSVRVRGYAPPALNTPAGQAAATRLAQLVQGRQIHIGPIYRVDQDSMVCDVYIEGKNLADFFPEY